MCVAIMEGSQAKSSWKMQRERGRHLLLLHSQMIKKNLIGQPAKRQAVTNPENTIFAVKRLIGRNFDDPNCKKKILRPHHSKIVNSEKGDAWIEV